MLSNGILVVKPGLNLCSGGLVDPGERLVDAVEREVMEETGIKCQFRAVASFRESHNSRFGGMTDFYCICACVLDKKTYYDKQDPTPIPQEKEIAACKWMDAEEFFNLRFYKRPSLFSDILKHGYKTAKEVLQYPGNAVYSGANGLGYRRDAKSGQGIFTSGKL